VVGIGGWGLGEEMDGICEWRVESGRVGGKEGGLWGWGVGGLGGLGFEGRKGAMGVWFVSSKICSL